MVIPAKNNPKLVLSSNRFTRFDYNLKKISANIDEHDVSSAIKLMRTLNITEPTRTYPTSGLTRVKSMKGSLDYINLSLISYSF